MFVLFAFLMLSCTTYVQDLKAQSEGTLLVVPRLDLDPAYYGGESWGFDLGSTSLYTLFEGNISKNLSFSVCNHWFAFTSDIEDAAELYRLTGKAYECNWVDWANLTLKLGNFFVSAGKDYMRVANFEIEEYDYNSHWQMNSFLWNNFQVYQWGGRVGWQNTDETLTVSLQMTTDPGMNRFFETSNLANYAYTFNTFYEGETVSVMGSVTHSGSWGWMGALGAKVGVTDVLTLCTDLNVTNFLKSGSLSLEAKVSDKLGLVGKVGYDAFSSNWDEYEFAGRFFSGVLCNWYPLRDSEDLRVHFMVAPSVTKTFLGSDTDLYLSAGATYFFEFNLF